MRFSIRKKFSTFARTLDFFMFLHLIMPGICGIQLMASLAKGDCAACYCQRPRFDETAGSGGCGACPVSATFFWVADIALCLFPSRNQPRPSVPDRFAKRSNGCTQSISWLESSEAKPSSSYFVHFTVACGQIHERLSCQILMRHWKTYFGRKLQRMPIFRAHMLGPSS
jgi:hypothetical protein